MYFLLFVPTVSLICQFIIYAVLAYMYVHVFSFCTGLYIYVHSLELWFVYGILCVHFIGS